MENFQIDITSIWKSIFQRFIFHNEDQAQSLLLVSRFILTATSLKRLQANNDKKVPCESMPYLSVQFHLVNDLYKKMNDGNVALNSVKKKLFFFYDL